MHPQAVLHEEFMRERKDARDMKIYKSILATLGSSSPTSLGALVVKGTSQIQGLQVRRSRVFNGFQVKTIQIDLFLEVEMQEATTSVRNQHFEQKRRDDFEKKQQDEASREEKGRV